MRALLVAGAAALAGCSFIPVASSTTPQPTPIAKPIVVRGPIPSGQPVVLYRRLDARGSNLSAASWTGVLYVGPNAPVVGRDRASPDGSQVLFGVVVYDVATGAQTRLEAAIGMWGDDNKHLCLTKPLDGDGSPSEISIALPGSPAVVLAHLGSHAVQIPGATVLACSPTSGRIVVAQVGGLNDTQELWVLNASTGAIESHRTYPFPTKTNGNVGDIVVASPDGQYLAETDALTGSTSIRRIADDTVVARLLGEEVHGFSWTGDLVVATPRPPDFATDNGTFEAPVVIDWRTGKTVWQSPQGARFFGRMVAQPGGSSIALALNFCATSSSCQEDLWLVRSDGKGRELDRNVELLSP